MKRYLGELSKKGLVVISKHREYGYPIYWANSDSQEFLFLKKVDMILSISESGLLDCIEEKLIPEVVVLFGSASRGDNLKGSDIDLFMICREKSVDLSKFEKKLGRKISPLFCENFNKLSKELRNNVINGVILKGYLKVF